MREITIGIAMSDCYMQGVNEMLRGIENFVRAGLRAGLLREASAAEKTEGKAV